ncbi:MAG: cytochrome c4 [Sulfuritalea sp.]|nr:cytochrome c4 [Sulfuritalea sp.]
MNRPLKYVLSILALITTNSLAHGATDTSSRVADIVRQRCIECHGPTGQGTNSQFPKLSGQNADYLVKQMFNFKSGARKSSVMAPQLADLTGEEIVQLAHHFSGERLIPEVTMDKALIEVGREVFMTGNPAREISACAVCHGPTARGGQMLPRLAGQHADYIELQLRRFIERSRTTDQTLMHSVASKMTDAEIRAVSYFLSGLD